MYYTYFSHCSVPTSPRTALGTLSTERCPQPSSQSPCDTGVKPQTGDNRPVDKLLGKTKQRTSRWKAVCFHTPAAEPFIFITLYLSAAHNSLFYNAFLFSYSSLPDLHEEASWGLQRACLPRTHTGKLTASPPSQSPARTTQGPSHVVSLLSSLFLFCVAQRSSVEASLH